MPFYLGFVHAETLGYHARLPHRGVKEITTLSLAFCHKKAVAIHATLGGLWYASFRVTISACRTGGSFMQR